MPGIFTLARRNVRSDGTIILGFWGDVKGFWSRIFRIAEDCQDCLGRGQFWLRGYFLAGWEGRLSEL